MAHQLSAILFNHMISLKLKNQIIFFFLPKWHIIPTINGMLQAKKMEIHWNVETLQTMLKLFYCREHRHHPCAQSIGYLEISHETLNYFKIDCIIIFFIVSFIQIHGASSFIAPTSSSPHVYSSNLKSVYLTWK